MKNKIQEYFTKEAHSLISDAEIKEILAKEEYIFENATSMGIDTKKIVDGNLLRHCKNLLRKRQPFYFFYLLLNFLTELSMLLLLFGALFSVLRFFANGSNPESFSKSFPVVYGLVFLTVILLYQSLNRAILRSFLQKINLKGQADTPKIEKSKKKLTSYRAILILALAVICILSVYILIQTGLAMQMQVTLFDLFMGYVLLIFVSGIHNTLYSSHVISFLSIGGFLLTKRSSEEVKNATEQYMTLSFLQLLGNRNKTMTDFENDHKLAQDIKTALRSRMVTQRVYIALAIFVLVLLLGVCIHQIRLAFSVALLAFSGLVLFIVIGLVTALLSANFVVRELRK